MFGSLLGLLSGAISWQFSWVRGCIGALGVGVLAYHLDPNHFNRNQSRPTNLLTLSHADWSSARLTCLSWTLGRRPAWRSHSDILFISGNVHWTEEGHNFAWHMMLRQKEAEGFFVVTDLTTGKEWDLNPRQYITRIQLEHMLSRPHMVIQFAHYAEQRLRNEGYTNIAIRARITAALNGREAQYLIDPEVDLTQVAYPWWGHAEWILPLEKPLRDTRGQSLPSFYFPYAIPVYSCALSSLLENDTGSVII